MRLVVPILVLWVSVRVLSACGGDPVPPPPEPTVPCLQEGGSCVGEPQSSTCAHPLQLSCGVNNAGLSCCLESSDGGGD